MRSKHFIFLLSILFVFTYTVNAQETSVSETKKTEEKKPNIFNRKSKTDSTKVKIHTPRTASIRSAILPGLGQAYNKSYWKIPVVYGALGVTVGIFSFNLKNYKDTRFAYQAMYKAALPLPQRDSTDYSKIRPDLVPLSSESLKFYRDQYRRDIDYSVLFFLLAWGLNVVDATVDAHLKTFDISPELSLKIKPGHSEMAGTNGLSIVLKIGK